MRQPRIVAVPPAPNQANPPPLPEPALANPVDRASGENPGHPQPRRGPATRDTSCRSGGES